MQSIFKFCSLYLNAEPLPNEKVHPLLTGSGSQQTLDIAREVQGRTTKSKSDGNMEDKWTRKGLFRFTFNIQTMDDKTNLGTKEAHDHAFSHKTSNWGWAQFAKRDHVYYKNADVIRDDGFLISVTITSSPEKPQIAKPISHVVPPVLVHAMGSLLDDPEHSDVVFYLYSRRRGNGKTKKSEVKKVYAIRKILSARSEYFRDMFESGFQEAEAEESSSEEEAVYSKSLRVKQTPAHPQKSHHAAARAEQARRAMDSDEGEEAGEDNEDLDAEEYEEQAALMEDSDEDIDELERSITTKDGSQVRRSPSTLRDNSPNEDESVDSEEEEEEEAGIEEARERFADDAVESEEEGEGEATGDDAFVAAPQPVRVGSRGANRRESSATFVDATSNHGADFHYTGEQASDAEVEDENLASASINTSANEISSSLATNKVTSRAKRERSGANEASTVRGKQEPVAAKRPSNVHRRKRRKVSIVDSAYPTFKALLFFLYTDTVEFAPLTSSFLPSDVAADDAPSSNSSVSLFASRRGRVPSGRFSEEMEKARKKRKSLIESHLVGYPEKPSPCSAKAMYRLADKLDIPDLKQRAQDHIAMSLTIQNIVWEVFSGFTAHYPDILKMETDFLLKHWPQVKRINAMKSIFLRHSAHPGLAQVWPHLLECLEYKRPEVDDPEEVAAL